MKQRTLAFALGAVALAVTSAASARVSVSIGVNPYGYGAYAPPVVYQPDSYYGAPPVVYFGGGSWGDHRRWRNSRGHDAHSNGDRDRRDDGRHH